MAWHIKGAAGTLPQWRRLSEFDRSVITAEIARRIELHNDAYDT